MLRHRNCCSSSLIQSHNILLLASSIHSTRKTRHIKYIITRCSSANGNGTYAHAHLNGNGKHAFPLTEPGHDRKYDLVLSSGFLAFSHHAGFLQAVEDAGIRVSGVMGTSAGALAGALFCAGYTPDQVNKQLSLVPPMFLLRPTLNWMRGGMLSFDGVVERLRDVLPPRFEDLKYEFACGVVSTDGQHHIIDSGTLPEAVAASAAIPYLFTSVRVPGYPTLLKDGGVVDRVGLRAWRRRRRAQLVNGRPPPPCLVHVIARSSPFSGADNVRQMGESDVICVHSPKSDASLASMGDVSEVFRQSTERATIVFKDAFKKGGPSGSRDKERDKDLAGPVLI